MAKSHSKRQRELTERLHALGLRRRVARNIAHGATSVAPALPDAVKDLLGKVDERVGAKAKKAKKDKKAKKGKAAAQAADSSAHAGPAAAAPKKKGKKKRAKHG